MLFAFSLLRGQCALEASRWPRDDTPERQDGLKRGPRRAQERPGAQASAGPRLHRFGLYLGQEMINVAVAAGLPRH